MSTVILVPVKDFATAKVRMAGVLSVEERSRLASAMLADLVRALKPLAARVAFVTDSPEAARTAARKGWRIFWETCQISESASVDEASHRLAIERAESVLRLPADIPLAKTEDIQALLDLQPRSKSAILVPSWNRMGTNALMRKPPNLFPSRFGRNSFVLHTHEAMRARANIQAVDLPRLALDLDDPGDLARFLEQDSDTATRRLLVDWKVAERLG